jgi:hypothetical protein
LQEQNKKHLLQTDDLTWQTQFKVCGLPALFQAEVALPSPTLLDLLYVQEPFETHSPTTTTTPLISKKNL